VLAGRGKVVEIWYRHAVHVDLRRRNRGGDFHPDFENNPWDLSEGKLTCRGTRQSADH
jgi:hypothetical protein